MKGRLRDFTNVATIYRRDVRTTGIRLGRRKMRTIQVRRKRAFLAPSHDTPQVTTPAEANEHLSMHVALPALFVMSDNEPGD